MDVKQTKPIPNLFTKDLDLDQTRPSSKFIYYKDLNIKTQPNPNPNLFTKDLELKQTKPYSKLIYIS